MYLVTGASGQLGLELRALLGNSAFYADREELDIASEDAVKNFLSNRHFDFIINCAAYTAVDKAELEPEKAEAINHVGAGWLAKYGKNIIHISTDYVFDGKNFVPYLEDDRTNPVSVYGRTKLSGEQAVLKNAETALIIRTSWLYSAHGSNFLKTMLRFGKERSVVNVVADQIGTPTFAGDLANAIVKILPHVKKGERSIFHFSNNGVCSWYDFAHAIMQMACLSCKVNPILSKDFPAKASRPFYSVLNKEKIKREFGLEIAHWRDSLFEVLKNMKEN